MHILRNFYPKHKTKHKAKLATVPKSPPRRAPKKEHVKISNTAKLHEGQTHGEWQTFEILENKRQMCGSELRWSDCHTFVSYFHLFGPQCTALKLGCVTNFNMLYLVTGFISLVDEIKLKLISSRQFVRQNSGDSRMLESINPIYYFL